MVNGITWEESTLARLNEAKDKLRQHEDRVKQEEVETDYWKRYVSALENVLNLTKQQNGHKPIDSERFLTQSTWDNLKIIMEANNGILVVIDAVAFLVEAKVFKDREHARNVVYSTLYSHKKDIKKVRKGIYRLLVGQNTEQNKSTKRGTLVLKQPIQELKTANPNMSKEDVIASLITSGHDFQGKNPKKAVSMAWVSLGYTKKEKEIQQSLPGVS